MEAVRCGLASPDKPAPVRSHHKRLNPTQMRRYRELERRRDRRAAELEIDPALIASRATLLVLAEDSNQAGEVLMNWQRQVLDGRG